MNTFSLRTLSQEELWTEIRTVVAARSPVLDDALKVIDELYEADAAGFVSGLQILHGYLGTESLLGSLLSEVNQFYRREYRPCIRRELRLSGTATDSEVLSAWLDMYQGFFIMPS